MVYVEADNILSPLGMTTSDNLQAVLAGRSALRRHDDPHGRLEPFTASLLTEEQRAAIAIDGLTEFEAMVVRSARVALSSVDLEPSSSRVVLIISTTKGNTQTPSQSLGAEAIASALNIVTPPIVVCNACISGLAAIILAQRLLEAGLYDHAIVCGADVQGEFIISGFQSLKALSPDECRPFDMERMGLNLGEAAATIILGSKPAQRDGWAVCCGSIHNDAYHTTQPAKRGDGLLLCLQDILEESEEWGIKKEHLALINAHGTATLFNDQMESVAIERAGLTNIPVNALKGYFGHTMGAAGILESILTMHALNEHTLIGTRGYEERGVSGKILLSAHHQPTSKTAFIKTISGFGGCNAAMIFKKFGEDTIVTEKRQKQREERKEKKNDSWNVVSQVRITPDGVLVNGKALNMDSKPTKTATRGLPFLTQVYKYLGCNYPKFYKMDALCRLGFLAAELIVASNPHLQLTDIKNRAHDCDIILFNRTSSILSDKKYLASINGADGYFPSPTVFIYTLPNIVTGEIAIRHGLHGETSFYILPKHDEALQQQIIQATLAATDAQNVLSGWIDYADDATYEVHLCLYINNV